MNKLGLIFLFAQFAVLGYFCWTIYPPLRDAVVGARVSSLVSGAERLLDHGARDKAAARIERAIELRGTSLSAARRALIVSRACDRRLWELASVLVFFHEESSWNDRMEIVGWSLVNGEYEFFDKLVSVLPKGTIESDAKLAKMVEIRRGMELSGR
jgi:hypothetical protein